MSRHKRFYFMLLQLFFTFILLIVFPASATLPVPYDLVYVRSPRYGDTTNIKWFEVFHPIHFEPGTDLMLLRQDGTEEILVPGGVDGAIADPVVSFDGQWVYYAHFPNVRVINDQRKLPMKGSDLYKIHVATREIVRLTFGEWTPTTGIAHWMSQAEGSYTTSRPPAGKNSLGYGVFNTGAAPLPGGKVMFTSSRNGLLPTKGYTRPNLQLFVLDEGTGLVEQVGYLNLGSALHPVVLTDGRVMFSSYESQGLRDPRVWGVWAMFPDGRNWEPLLSAFSSPFSLHGQTQLSNGSPAVIAYYNLNNGGFGALLSWNNFPLGMEMAPPIARFGSPNRLDPSNPKILTGYASNGTVASRSFPFSPLGIKSLTPFARPDDRPSDLINGMYLGKVKDPSAAPGSNVILAWSPGPAHRKTDPKIDAGLYLLVNNTPAYTPTDLVLIKNNPLYNEHQPKPLVTYQAIYGIPEPATLPWVPNVGVLSPYLPAGTPFGLVGTSTMYKRDSAPGNSTSNWCCQGSDAGVYTNADLHAVRLILQEPNSHISYGVGSNHGTSGKYWSNGVANERFKVLGDVPLRKYQQDGTPVLDVDGNPDTSFLAKIPADHVFTFQTLDQHGHALNTSQTWHQLRPGEVRTDCGGCHAHSQIGTNFAKTAAGQPGFVPADLTQTPPWTVEYSDITSILQEKCPECVGLTYEQISAMALPFQSRISSLMTKMVNASETELRQIRTWIDLGMPRSLKQALVQNTTGWREWNTRPAVDIRVKIGTEITCPIGCIPSSARETQLRVGMFAYPGIQGWSVVGNTPIGDTPAGVNLAGHFTSSVDDASILVMTLPITGQSIFTVTVRDNAGVETVKKLAVTW